MPNGSWSLLPSRAIRRSIHSSLSWSSVVRWSFFARCVWPYSFGGTWTKSRWSTVPRTRLRPNDRSSPRCILRTSSNGCWKTNVQSKRPKRNVSVTKVNPLRGNCLPSATTVTCPLRKLQTLSMVVVIPTVKKIIHRKLMNGKIVAIMETVVVLVVVHCQSSARTRSHTTTRKRRSCSWTWSALRHGPVPASRRTYLRCWRIRTAPSTCWRNVGVCSR